MNLVELPVVAEGAQSGDYVIPLPADVLAAAREKGLDTMLVGFRPEDMAISDHGMSIDVEVVEVLGVDAYVYGSLQGAATPTQIVLRADGRRPPRYGDVIKVVVKPGHEHAFEPTGAQERIGN
jgi:multiple sugar transport system ATP-binding protein